MPKATHLLTSTEAQCRLGVALAVPPSSDSLGPGYKHSGAARAAGTAVQYVNTAARLQRQHCTGE